MNDALQGLVRGTVAAMAMTGMREVTRSLGLVSEPPPEQMFRRHAKGLMRAMPRGKRRALIELLHWGVGAAGGTLFGAVPDGVREQPWTGPLFGVAMWAGFQASAPLLGLPHAKSPRPLERLATAADHALYGFVLSETRRTPRY